MCPPYSWMHVWRHPVVLTYVICQLRKHCAQEIDLWNWASSETAIDKGCGGYIRDDDDEGHSETVYVYNLHILYFHFKN